jgi:glycosyltransferase involved in cell wall biosynthesis
VKYIPFVKYIYYPEIYIPIFINISKIIPNKSIVVTLLEYNTFNLIMLPNDVTLFLGYHTNCELYISNVFEKIAYAMHSSIAYMLNPKLILLSGFSSSSIIEKYLPNNKTFIWYDMNSKFLDYPIINYNYNKQEEINMIYTGRISCSQKNIDSLIKILYKYNKKYGKAKLTLYGDGPDINKYENIDNIHFYGNIPQAALYNEYKKYINKNAVFVFASTTETLGKSPIEASLCGLPVFTALSPETPFIYKDGVNGFTFSSMKECCSKINKFIHLPEAEQKNIITNGKLLKNLFDPNIYSKIYKKMIK